MLPVAFILLAVWTLAVLYSTMGPYIHVLLVVGVVIIIYSVLQGSRTEGTIKR